MQIVKVLQLTVFLGIVSQFPGTLCWPGSFPNPQITTPQSNILLITMGATRSHKIPFIALAEGLIAK